MDAKRFDALARHLGTRRSRRAALGGGGAGLLGAALDLAGRRVAATERAAGATPAATPPATGVDLLFVQAFASGTFAPKPNAAGVYVLTLRDGLGETVAFADRPA